MQTAGLQLQRVWSPRPGRNPELACLTSFQVSLMLLVWDAHFSNYPSKLSGVFSFPSWSGCDVLACFNLLPQELNPTQGSSCLLGCDPGNHHAGIMVVEKGSKEGHQERANGSVSPSAAGSYCCHRPLRGLRIYLLRIWRPGFPFPFLTLLRLLLRI